MTSSLAERHGAKSSPLTRVAGLAARGDDFGELARYLSGDSCRIFEQEMLRPMDPLEATQ
jgi:hypothetical protein